MKIDKDEISHPSHPRHKLKIEYTQTVFKCDGCKEEGIGLKYKCDKCEFDLHKTCALAPTTIRHSFRNCKLGFHDKPPGPVSRKCDACIKDVLGFVYHCSHCGFDLHPSCAYLPEVLDYGETKLHLCKKLSRSCNLCCEKKGPGWSYRSKCNEYNLHVGCVKKLRVDRNKKVREIDSRIPKGTLIKNHPKEKKGKLRKYCEIVAAAVRIIISAILGDPTAIIAAALVSLKSN